jgi:hypothetical protein
MWIYIERIFFLKIWRTASIVFVYSPCLFCNNVCKFLLVLAISSIDEKSVSLIVCLKNVILEKKIVIHFRINLIYQEIQSNQIIILSVTYVKLKILTISTFIFLTNYINII